MRFLPPEEVLANPSRGLAGSNVIHVWPWLLDGPDAARARCAAVLSAQELERASRFRFEHLRSRFIFAHGLMRYVLGAYRGIAPRDLELTESELGKPALVPDARRPNLWFNLSHSHERALLAVSMEREVGADLECEKSSTDALGIASSYFFGPEFDAIRNSPPERQTAMFFRLWVAKEAVLKGQGTGLRVALDSFHVRFEPDLKTAHVDTLDVASVAPGWMVRCLDGGAGWHAAVAAVSPDWTLQLID
jgi:4'-phosphopantetheinyl transferase